MATLQRIDHWRLWSLGGAPGWQVATRQRLLEHLQAQGWQPVKLTLREEDGAQRFDTAIALQPMRGPWPGGLLLEGPCFDVWLDLSHRAALELRCQGGTLDELAAWADRLFARTPPCFAWLVPWGAPAPAGLADVLDEMQAATGPGRDVPAHGPAGPGLVTWIGPGVAAGLRDAAAALAPLRVTRSPNDLLRLDLACAPEASVEERLRMWPAARDACLASGWFAGRLRHAGGGESWQPGRHWPAAVPQAPTPAPLPEPPPPAAASHAGSADDLAAAARAGVSVTALKLTGVLAAGADWRNLRAQDVDFGQGVLSRADLRHTTLVDCDFDAARLDHARLDSAKLDQVRLRHAHAPALSLVGATLTHCFLQHAVLTGARFNGALLRGCHAVGIDAERADFDAALLEDVDFTGAKLRGARFVRTVLRGCCFDGADLRGVDWTDATLQACSRDGART